MKRVKIGVVIGVMGLLLLGTGVTVWAQRLSKNIFFEFQKLYLQLPGDKSGQKVLSQAWYELNQVHTAQLNADMQFSGQNNSQTFMTAHSVGALKSGKDDNTQVYLQTQAEATIHGFTFNGAGESVVTQDALFVKLNQVPQLPLLNLNVLTSGWFETQFANYDANILKNLPTVGKATRQQRGEQEVFEVPVAFTSEQLEILGTQLFGDNFQLTTDQLPPLHMVVLIDAHSFLPVVVKTSTVISLERLPVLEGWHQFLAGESEIIWNADLDFSDFGQQTDFSVPENTTDVSQVSKDFILKMVDLQGNVLGAFTQVFDTPLVTPRELQDLTPYQRALLQQQGLEVEQVIP